jgi:hypothetical protein
MANSCLPDNTARLWDAATGKKFPAFKGHDGYVISVAFSDGKLVLTGSGDMTADGALRRFELRFFCLFRKLCGLAYGKRSGRLWGIFNCPCWGELLCHSHK